MPTPEELEQLRAYGQALLTAGQQPIAEQSGNPYAYVSPLSIITRGMQSLQGRSALDLIEPGRRRNRATRVSGLPGVSLSPSALTGQPEDPPSPPGGGQPQPGVVAPPRQPGAQTGFNLHPRFVDTLIGIESSGNPRALSPSGRYRGLGQFSEDLEQLYGITDWTNPDQQRRAIALHATSNARALRQRLGRDPSPGELYLAHQQGVGGAAVLLANPNATAFDALMSLPYYGGNAGLVRTAIENNLPSSMKRQWRTISARDFANTWISRFNSRIGVASVSGATVSPGGEVEAPMMRLGGPQEAEGGPEGPRLPSGPELAPEQELFGAPGANLFIGAPGAGRGVLTTAASSVPNSGDVIPETSVGAPGGADYYAGNRPSQLPPGVPQRIPPNPALGAITAQLRDPTAMNDEQFNQLLQRYQELAAPQSVQTAFGTATYNPLTGELMSFVPSTQRRTATFPGGSIEQDIMWDNGALRTIPRGPPSGSIPGVGVSVTDTSVGSGLRSRLRPFPQSGDPAELSEWGMEAQALGAVGANRGASLAKRIEEAETVGLQAATNLRTLDQIRTATLASANARWTGTRLSEWQRQVSTFLYNFDPNNSSSLPALQALPWNELLGKLNAYLAAQATSAISARGTNFEFGTFLQQNPNVAQTPQGTLMMIEYLSAERRREQAIGNMAARLADEGPQAYSRLHRMIEDYDRRNPVYITVPPGVNGYPTARRVTTQRIPDVGELKPDGSGSYTAQEIRAIIQALPSGVWYINPRTNNLVTRSPTVRATASSP